MKVLPAGLRLPDALCHAEIQECLIPAQAKTGIAVLVSGLRGNDAPRDETLLTEECIS